MNKSFYQAISIFYVGNIVMMNAGCDFFMLEKKIKVL